MTNKYIPKPELTYKPAWADVELAIEHAQALADRDQITYYVLQHQYSSGVEYRVIPATKYSFSIRINKTHLKTLKPHANNDKKKRD